MGHYVTPPATEAELLERATGLTGKTLGQIARQMQIQVPTHPVRAKGWIGELMEIYLGATASSLPEPDFQAINVELKTLPINHNGRPRESTYVCTVPLTATAAASWENSVVKIKLSRVLWVPVEADPAIDLAMRRVGNPFIWSPDAVEEQQLRTDWEELMDMVCMGELAQISSQHGEVMQIRPKAANASARTQTSTRAGEAGSTIPRGFYLRPAFTYRIIQSQSGK
jgi:DNA mismatch repair protein MutH